MLSIGMVGILAIFLRAFSLGGGTYTGIEAVSNAMHVMREPKVQTGKRTMVYLAASLAITAGGLFICYLLYSIKPVEGRTLNAILADATFGDWPMGAALAFITILSEGALLMVGAQSGFAGGPAVMANMAIDSWLPRRFTALSERLTMQNGVFLMGGAAMLVLFYTGGSVSALVVMYSINVFLTFSLVPVRHDASLRANQASGPELEEAHHYPCHRVFPLRDHPGRSPCLRSLKRAAGLH